MPSRFPPAELAEPVGLVMIGERWRRNGYWMLISMGFFPGRLFAAAARCNGGRPIRGRFSSWMVFTCPDGWHELAVAADSSLVPIATFAGVLAGCATASGRTRRTWLTAPMIAAYRRLFDLGHAHSVEVWREGRLVGGTYGVAIGGLFAGESMFHLERDASKVALAHLVPHLRQRGYRLFDIQELSPHTASLGAIEIPRREYLRRLAEAIACSATFGELKGGAFDAGAASE